MIKFCIKTLGCKVNTYESEYIHNLFLEKGFVFSEENPDVYVINTCSVTNMSDRKSRQMIHSISKKYPEAIIIVCGCFSQNCYNKNMISELENLDAHIIIGNKDKSKIVDYLDEYLTNRQKIIRFYDVSRVEFENMEIEYMENRTRAFVKIEDGCNNFCSYCIIPYVRGRLRSKKFESVINEVKELVKNGHKEIVLTGIHTGAYNDGEHNFANLLKELVKIDGLVRLRISSIEINELNEEVLKIFSENEKLVPHLHIPLQSGSDRILKLMNRKYDKKFYKEKIEYIRSIKEDVSITTDVIVGFPSESEEDFKESLEFIEELKLTKVHIFPYSDREGTTASKMSDKIDGNIKKKRVKELEMLSDKLENEFYSKYYGKKMKVLFEEEKNGLFLGHTSNYIKVGVKEKQKLHEISEIVLNKENIMK